MKMINTVKEDNGITITWGYEITSCYKESIVENDLTSTISNRKEYPYCVDLKSGKF